MAKNENRTDHTDNTMKKKVNKDFVIRARVTAEERELFEKKAEERGESDFKNTYMSAKNSNSIITHL